MSKLLVNAPSGYQEIIEIGVGGGYFDESLVLWDDRVGGELPEVTLGGMVRDGSALEFSQTVYDASPEANPVTVVPDEVTALQGLLALDAGGMATDYETWANSVNRTFSEKAFINKALVWRKDSETIAAACLALGISNAERDELFVLAATLQP